MIRVLQLLLTWVSWFLRFSHVRVIWKRIWFQDKIIQSSGIHFIVSVQRFEVAFAHLLFCHSFPVQQYFLGLYGDKEVWGKKYALMVDICGINWGVFLRSFWNILWSVISILKYIPRKTIPREKTLSSFYWKI